MSSRKRVRPEADFGRALQQLRAARGLIQEDMLLATSRRHISRIEQGHQVPSLRTIEMLAEQMQMHPLTLLAAAYCPTLDEAVVRELLKTVESDMKSVAPAKSVLGG
ncbi:helix-turn-helix domain-containing protein [Acidovorax sp. NCPPB 3576]|uniref:helix-turn-helix domain-containing protein n=1 Tax=Acidovorax sp. NCPPB 3576 TaxID=2940488 RepID=UPI0023492720|nr:helix-turn-helix transcriptional regulator [Acidovorax sp. NCPPB 3576]WCM90485.1 helix-turn-helix domain-containing protein [Acidovorax sp. NCPPB 3576]